MNPQKFVAEDVLLTNARLVAVEIDSTEWFNFAKKTPGQPGVFEVNSVSTCDGEEAPRRYAFWNGVEFGPVRSNPDSAFVGRFDKRTLVDPKITQFRGLVEEAA